MTIAIDFDGTIVEDRYPEIGELKPGAKQVIELFKKENRTVVIWTCRTGKPLIEAINFLLEHQIPFDRINASCPNDIAKYGSDTRKINADIYIDDKNFGGFPGWEHIRQMYIDQYGLFNDETST